MRKPILILSFLLLMSCSAPITEHHFIEQIIPAPPIEPDYYSLAWKKQGGLYCLDEPGAKNLMKNVELLRGNEREMRKILDGLRTQGTLSH